jgi:hypothetical protein
LKKASLRHAYAKFRHSRAALAIPATFLILFVSTLSLVSVTYYFAVEKVNSRSQTLKIASAKQDFTALNQNIMSVVWQPGSARMSEVGDSGGKLNVQPYYSSMEINVTDNTLTGSAAFGPTGYALDDLTDYLSGNVTDLASNDEVYMTFRSYAGTNEYICEAEFSGTSNTKSWTQLDWTADLSFSTPNVTTSLQLYNYGLGQYPTSGVGFITDTIGQTDAIKTQSITAGSINFRDAAGNWVMKIRGTKANSTPFDMRVDWTQFNTTINRTINTNVFNSTVGQITYELPGAESAETGLFLKGDSRSITNQSGSVVTQLYIANGEEHPEICLRYRPTVTSAIAGTEDNRAVNNLRIYLINMNTSTSISLYGKIPLRISCTSIHVTTTKYTLSYNPEVLKINSIIDGASSDVIVPISSTAYGAVINLEIVECIVKIDRGLM